MITLTPEKELELRTLIDSYYSYADTAFTSMVGTLANEGWEYYYGLKPLSPIQGGSRYVDRSVFETVNGTVQDMLNVFVSGNEYCTIQTPIGEVGATQYLNKVITRQNAGYRDLGSVFKECCVARNSFIKYYWETCYTAVDEEFEDMTKDELQVYLDKLNQDETSKAHIVASTTDEYGLLTGILTHMKDTSQIVMEYAPLEEVIFSPDARSIKEATYLCHRTHKTREELGNMGFSKEKLERVGAGDQRVYFYSYEYTRQAGRMSQFDNNQQDLRDGQAKITLLEHYIRTSLINPDGRVKLYQVFTAGNNIILEINEVDRIPFATATPFPIPGSVYGESVVDITKDIQDVKTAIMRGYIDNIHNANHGSVMAVSGQYNKRDLIDNRPRRIVEVQTIGAVSPFPYNPLPQGIDNLLEHIEQAKELRSGVSRLNSGLSNDIFKNDNAFLTVNAAMTAAQNRLKMVARNIAENFMKDLIEGIYQLAREKDNRPFMMENYQGTQPVTPKKHWPEEFDIIIDIAIGQAEKQKYSQALIQSLQMLSQAPMLAGTAFTAQNAHYLAYNAMKYMGIKDLPQALTPLGMVQPPQPNPNQQKMEQLLLAEKEAMIAESQSRAQENQSKPMQFQAQIQMEQQKQMFEQQKAADDFKLKVQDFTSKGQREADRTQNEQMENQIRMIREQLDAQIATSKATAEQEEAADKMELEFRKLKLEAKKLELEQRKLELESQKIQAELELEYVKIQQKGDLDGLKALQDTSKIEIQKESQELQAIIKQREMEERQRSQSKQLDADNAMQQFQAQQQQAKVFQEQLKQQAAREKAQNDALKAQHDLQKETAKQNTVKVKGAADAAKGQQDVAKEEVKLSEIKEKIQLQKEQLNMKKETSKLQKNSDVAAKAKKELE